MNETGRGNAIALTHLSPYLITKLKIYLTLISIIGASNGVFKDNKIHQGLSILFCHLSFIVRLSLFDYSYFHCFLLKNRNNG